MFSNFSEIKDLILKGNSLWKTDEAFPAREKLPRAQEADNPLGPRRTRS